VKASENINNLHAVNNKNTLIPEMSDPVKQNNNKNNNNNNDNNNNNSNNNNNNNNSNNNNNIDNGLHIKQQYELQQFHQSSNFSLMDQDVSIDY
jgi:hypothetical protein